jgi:selT/selW/selH-like putative selenoprotein
LADELKANLGVDAQLISGRGGIFDVAVDGTVIFSKKITDRFPETGEVTELLKATPVRA